MISSFQILPIFRETFRSLMHESGASKNSWQRELPDEQFTGKRIYTNESILNFYFRFLCEFYKGVNPV